MGGEITAVVLHNMYSHSRICIVAVKLLGGEQGEVYGFSLPGSPSTAWRSISNHLIIGNRRRPLPREARRRPLGNYHTGAHAYRLGVEFRGAH